MSQYFEMGVVHANLWNRDRIPELVKLGAVNGDVVHAITRNSRDVVAILVDNVLEPIDVSGNRVHIVREFTDRYRNALKHFANVVKILFDDGFEVLIEVHPSDEGLGDYVVPIDLRLHSYGLLYTAHGKFVLYSPIECKQPRDRDGDRCCSACGIIEGFFTDSASDADDVDDVDFHFPFPGYVGQCVAIHIEQSQMTMTEVVIAFKQHVANSIRLVRADTQPQRSIVGHDGKIFTLEEGYYYTRRHEEMCDVHSFREELLSVNVNNESFAFAAIAGPNRLFKNAYRYTLMPTLRRCAAMVPSYTMERICDFSIAMSLGDLPVYVILWIIDFLPGTQYVAHIKKLRYIEAVQKSIRKVREARSTIKHAK